LPGNLPGARELHHSRRLNLPEPHQQLLRVLQQGALKETQRAVFLEALNDDDVLPLQRVAGLSPLALHFQIKSGQGPLQLGNLGPPPLSIRHLHAAPRLSYVVRWIALHVAISLMTLCPRTEGTMAVRPLPLETRSLLLRHLVPEDAVALHALSDEEASRTWLP